MKKLSVFLLVAVMVFGELGIMQIQAAAKRAIDERAAALFAQARAAIGGETAINNVNNIAAKGKLTHKIKLPDNQEHSATGDVEFALEATRAYKTVKITVENGSVANGEHKIISENKRVIRTHAGETGETGDKIKRVSAVHQQNDLSRMWLGMLLKTAPDTNYTAAGEGSVDGAACDIIEATGATGAVTKLYLDKNSHLPVMVSYRGTKQQKVIMMKKHGSDELAAAGSQVEKNVMVIRTPDGVQTTENDGQPEIFVRKEGNKTIVTDPNAKTFTRVPAEEVEFQLRFSDFRSVGGLLLPHKFVQYADGQIDEETIIESYEINVQNLAERFKGEITIIKNDK